MYFGGAAMFLGRYGNFSTEKTIQELLGLVLRLSVCSIVYIITLGLFVSRGWGKDMISSYLNQKKVMVFHK